MGFCQGRGKKGKSVFVYYCGVAWCVGDSCSRVSSKKLVFLVGCCSQLGFVEKDKKRNLDFG